MGCLSADEKKLFARQMEIFAGFGEYADTEIGRLIQAIAATGQLDNTLIFYTVGDNGASAEGGMNGLFNENTYFNGVNETVGDVLRHYDELGGPTTYPHYAAGWAVAGDTPFTWTKQIASNYGGTRNGMVVHWPKGLTAKGELRTQWHHVIDVAPTILEAAGLPAPKSVNGTVQTPIEGVSMLYSFADAKAPTGTRRSTSRSPATAPSITMAGWPGRSIARRGSSSRGRRSKTIRGSYTTRGRISAWRMIWRRRIPRRSRRCRTSFSGKRSNTPCCPSTTAPSRD